MIIEQKQYISAFFFFTAALLLSCGNHEASDKNAKIIEINNIYGDTISGIRDFAHFDSLVERINIIPIEEMSGAFLGDITGFYATKNNYILADPYVAKKINLHNKAGKFIKTIVSVGRGPHELPQLADAFLDEKEVFYVYDPASKKMLVYDTSFNIKSTLRNLPISRNFQKIPGTDKFVSYAGVGYGSTFEKKYMRFFYHNVDFSTSSAFLNYSPKVLGTIYGQDYMENFTLLDDRLSFMESHSNKVYTVDKNGLEVTYKLKYQKNNLPDDFLTEVIAKNPERYSDNISPIERNRLIYSKYAYNLGYWLENKRYILLQSSTPNDKSYLIYFSVYDKKKEKIIVNTLYPFVEKYKYRPSDLRYFDRNDGSFVEIVSGNILDKYSLGKKSNLRKFLTIGKGVENKYIVKVKFKDQ